MFGWPVRFGSWNARLSFELTVTACEPDTAELSGTEETSVCVLQKSTSPSSPFGGVRAEPPMVAESTPVWKHGAIWSTELALLTAVPLSIASIPSTRTR